MTPFSLKNIPLVGTLPGEVVGRGQYLSADIGKALFQIRGNPELFADGVKKERRPVKAAGCLLYRDRTSFMDPVMIAGITGRPTFSCRDDFLCFGINPSSASTCGTRLFFFFISVG